MTNPTPAHLTAAKALYSAGILAATEAQLGCVAQIIAAAMEKYEQQAEPIFAPAACD